jgi:CheY-like chemotaxis protein
VTVVGRAHAGGEALERAPALRPHVVLVDASLPDASGFEVTRRIRALPDPPRVFLLTFHQSQAVEAEALAAGAFGCLDKTEVAHLFAGIRGPFPRNPEPPSPTGRNR